MPGHITKRLNPAQSEAWERLRHINDCDTPDLFDAALTEYAATLGVAWPPSNSRGGAAGVSLEDRGDLPLDEATIPLRVVSAVTRTGTQVLLNACASGWLKARKKKGDDRVQPYWHTSVKAINEWWHMLGKTKVWTDADFE